MGEFKIPKLSNNRQAIAGLVIVGTLVLTVILSSQLLGLQSTNKALHAQEQNTKKSLDQVKEELETLKKEDQLVINKALKAEIDNIQKVYKKAVATYEKLLVLKEKTDKTGSLDDKFAEVLSLLAERKYSSAEGMLTLLSEAIDTESAKYAAAFAIPAQVASSNAPPASGYSRQKVDTSVGSYLVDIVAADLNSTRVIVDTASDGTCGNDCPVASLGDYAGRSGAFAAINGPYFCPASYPSCAGKTNSFDTLLMNKNKIYFNSDNNVYSNVPVVIFSGNSARFIGASSGWGRDTGVDSVIAAQPMLMSGGARVFGGDGEVKREGKGSRSFIGASGSTVYIGVVHNASVAEVAHVLETLGVQNALNLDSGGSTAMMWQGKYLVGPGRATPFGILVTGK